MLIELRHGTVAILANSIQFAAILGKYAPLVEILVFARWVLTEPVIFHLGQNVQVDGFVLTAPGHRVVSRFEYVTSEPLGLPGQMQGYVLETRLVHDVTWTWLIAHPLVYFALDGK